MLNVVRRPCSASRRIRDNYHYALINLLFLLTHLLTYNTASFKLSYYYYYYYISLFHFVVQIPRTKTKLNTRTSAGTTTFGVTRIELN